LLKLGVLRDSDKTIVGILLIVEDHNTKSASLLNLATKLYTCKGVGCGFYAVTNYVKYYLDKGYTPDCCISRVYGCYK